MAPSGHQVGTKWALSREKIELLTICEWESILLEFLSNTGGSDQSKFRKNVPLPLIEEGFSEPVGEELGIRGRMEICLEIKQELQVTDQVTEQVARLSLPEGYISPCKRSDDLLGTESSPNLHV